MAVTKFYASWEKENGETEVINAFQALRLREDAIIFTKPKEKGRLYDIETGLHVLPRQSREYGSGQPYFSYYAKEESPLKNLPSSFAYTPELNVFLRAFDGIRKFRIQEGKSDPVIEIFVEHCGKLQRIETESTYFIVKIYLKLLETKPYSFFYKYNGRLALEFLATSEPIPLKRVELAKRGIPLFEASAVIPEWIRNTLPEEFKTEESFDQIAKRIRQTYSKTNYRLLGRFKKEAIILPEYQERYQIMERFEAQCREMEEEIKELKEEQKELKETIKGLREEICDLKKEKEELQKELEELRLLIEEEKKILEEYQRKNEYYKQLEKDNDILTEENKKLVEENKKLVEKNEELVEKKEDLKEKKEDLKEKNKDLKEENKDLKEENKDLKKGGTWLSRLFMRKG